MKKLLFALFATLALTSCGDLLDDDFVADCDIEYDYYNDVYEIKTAAGLSAFADLVNGYDEPYGLDTKGDVYFDGYEHPEYNAKLMTDINIRNIDWLPIGGNFSVTNVYSGEFDGNYKTISGLNFYDTSDDQCRGLFGALEFADIKNLTVSGEVYASIAECVGGIAGYAEGSSFYNCKADVKVSGYDYVGGIVGYAEDCDIEYCINWGDISGQDRNTCGQIYGIDSYNNSYFYNNKEYGSVYIY